MILIADEARSRGQSASAVSRSSRAREAFHQIRQDDRRRTPASGSRGRVTATTEDVSEGFERLQGDMSI